MHKSDRHPVRTSTVAMRLHKFIAQASRLSRRAAERAIAAGEVRVNGVTVTTMGITVTPGQDRVEWQGLLLYAGRERQYLAYYKPKQTVVTKADPQRRRTIWDTLPPRCGALNAVGRLDYDSEGLLLLTNDGDLHACLTHPRYGVAKTYHVKVQGMMSEADRTSLVSGLRMEGERLAADTVRALGNTGKNMWLEMTLHGGRYRQIRRMCELIGHSVLKLKRVSIGPVHLRTLRPGKTRSLRPMELEALQKLVR